MKAATLWLFATFLGAVMADANETDFFRKAAMNWENDVFDAHNTTESSENVTPLDGVATRLPYPMNSPVLAIMDMTAVVPDRVQLGRLTYRALDRDSVIKFEFHNARLEGLSHFKTQNFSRIKSPATITADCFKIYYAKPVTFKADLVSSKLSVASHNILKDNCTGQVTVTLTDLTVQGTFSTHVDDDGLDMKMTVAISLGETSSAGFQPEVTECAFGDYLVDVMGRQPGLTKATMFKEMFIREVENTIFQHLNS